MLHPLPRLCCISPYELYLTLILQVILDDKISGLPFDTKVQLFGSALAEKELFRCFIQAYMWHFVRHFNQANTQKNWE